MPTSPKTKYREKVPWYLWRINLGAVFVAGLFAWMAWDFLTEPTGDPNVTVDWASRIMGFGIFGGLSAYCVWSIWANRYPLRFRIEPDEQERDGADGIAKRFQFSLRNMLAATFWVSAGLGAFALLRPLYTGQQDSEAWSGFMGVAFAYVLAVLLIASPFIAIGALFGRTRTGAIVGLTCMLLLPVAIILISALSSMMR